MPGDPRRRPALILALAGAAVIAACSGAKPPPPPPPIPVVTTTTPTTLPDYTTDSIAPVAGATTVPSIGVTPGQATLSGTVADDTGAPVAGATVQLQRIVGNAAAQADIATGADGSWAARGVGGGLYRVRAWRVPDLAQTTATVVFLSATGSQTVSLVVSHFTGLQVQSSVAPSPPILGEPVEIVIQVTGSAVGSDGVVRAQGEGGVQVELFGQGQWTLTGDPTVITTTAGTAAWDATCEGLGVQALSVLVNTTQAFPLPIPACVPVPPSTTSPSTTVTRGRTTTTRAK